ncbi:SLAM family member 9 isoform X2 [Siniperca chuatsi]|uniref:SLAM family member 9 isoform X2 n=1 Tax=Siniperca chuatsi TaxID=119488 RepID=UPI001CE13158|nr:SLAM family member 9 isoform X2 [Siniperca chuatsi]XP_044040747.1 SLAM family member 9 isoform X2 [Siniperca chuatsi]
MRLQILVIPFLQVALVALVDSLREVSGYLGDTVTLLSGADPSWNLSTVDWSIFSNNTWIATYRNGKENLERLDRYKGRLSLNISSGDLKIYNLTTEDAMEYTVDLINTEVQDSVNKIKLTVRKRLQEPTIQTVTCRSIEGGSWIGLYCSSKDKDVTFSWEVKPPSMTVFTMSHPNGSSAGLLAFVNTTQNLVEFTCTSSRHTESTSSVVTGNCDDEKLLPQPQPLPQPRSRDGVVFFIGCILGVLLTATITYLFGENLPFKK